MKPVALYSKRPAPTVCAGSVLCFDLSAEDGETKHAWHDDLGVSFTFRLLERICEADVFVQAMLGPLLRPPIGEVSLVSPTVDLLLAWEEDVAHPEHLEGLKYTTVPSIPDQWWGLLDSDSASLGVDAVVVPPLYFGRRFGDPWNKSPLQFEPLMRDAEAVTMIYPGSGLGVRSNTRVYTLYFNRLFAFINNRIAAGNVKRVALFLNQLLDLGAPESELATAGLRACLVQSD